MQGARADHTACCYREPCVCRECARSRQRSGVFAERTTTRSLTVSSISKLAVTGRLQAGLYISQAVYICQVAPLARHGLYGQRSVCCCVARINSELKCQVAESFHPYLQGHSLA